MSSYLCLILVPGTLEIFTRDRLLRTKVPIAFVIFSQISNIDRRLIKLLSSLYARLAAGARRRLRRIGRYSRPLLVGWQFYRQHFLLTLGSLVTAPGNAQGCVGSCERSFVYPIFVSH